MPLGHGWVIARPDAFKAQCGGPAICNACAAELQALGSPLPAPAAPAQPVDDGIEHLPGCTREHTAKQVCRMGDDFYGDADVPAAPIMPPPRTS